MKLLFSGLFLKEGNEWGFLLYVDFCITAFFKMKCEREESQSSADSWNWGDGDQSTGRLRSLKIARQSFGKEGVTQHTGCCLGPGMGGVDCLLRSTRECFRNNGIFQYIDCDYMGIYNFKTHQNIQLKLMQFTVYILYHDTFGF